MKFIYLASPYTHADPEVRKTRATLAALAAAHLMLAGVTVYSPIAHGHALAQVTPVLDAQSHSFWMDQCYPMLHHANALYILRAPGWEQSNGVALEHVYAETHGKPIFVSYNGVDWNPA